MTNVYGFILQGVKLFDFDIIFHKVNPIIMICKQSIRQHAHNQTRAC